ncbi:MAG: sodium:proton antiporter, partial [Coxiellaceae bacterium]|nr:sodium:proton antiporter [Coxiellaceae bacterium]
MNALEILPFILFIVVIVTSISERINVPYPLLLVIAGLVVGFIPGIPNWHPATDMILPLFLPPILFAAARLVSWQDIKNNFSTIGSLSIGLVVATAILVAAVLHFFIPQMSFSSALVLGAIISPTDTTAATAILSRMNIRQHIIRTVEVESLFNDAMGIVMYKAAVLFVYLGTINVADVGGETLLVGLGGIAVGFVFAYFTSLIVEQFFSNSENELPIIMSLILAYVAYMFADRVGVSGVLAVVAAGLYHRKTEQKIDANARLSETSVWSTLIFFLNGILFISIGMQFQS